MKEEKLIGSWQIIAFSVSDSLQGPPIWTFNPDNTIYIWYKEGSQDMYDTAFYYLEEEFNKYFISIVNFDQFTDGNWNIERMTNKFLILEQGIPAVRKEFVRK
ncbi:MAG: hypothetical protein HY738_23285 [Bacteroidia bacterium]|nr:hypothetical protein [Bacteroidia bacterium]